MKRGRPSEPGNPFGQDRPRGSPNKLSLIAQELLDSHGEAILCKALVMGLQGDSLLLRTLLSYILTRRTDLPVKTGPLCMGTPAEFSGTFEQLLKKVATQQLTLREARQIAALIEGRPACDRDGGAGSPAACAGTSPWGETLEGAMVEGKKISSGAHHD